MEINERREELSRENKCQNSARRMNEQTCYVPADSIAVPNQNIEHERQKHHRAIMQAPERLLHPAAGEILQQHPGLAVQIVVDVCILLAIITDEAGEKRWPE